jgi:pyridoxamine 5'-phosphate oxidase family protein
MSAARLSAAQQARSRGGLTMVFTDAELAYLRTQRLGRLATIAPNGTLHNNPVGFRVDADAGVIDIGGRMMGASQKFRNVAANGKVAFVVDDVPSTDPWTTRCFEVRGHAEALTGRRPRDGYLRGEIIRIHPTRIISWGLGPDRRDGSRRTVG